MLNRVPASEPSEAHVCDYFGNSCYLVLGTWRTVAVDRHKSSAMSNELLHAITLVQNLRILSQNQLTPSDRAILALEDCRQQQFAALGALETKLVEAKEWKNAVTRAWLPGEMVPQGSPDSVVGILLISHINRALDPNCSEDARQLENRYMARAIAAETETMSLRTEVARLRSILVAQASATPVPDQLTEGFESPDGFDAKTMGVQFTV